MKRTPSWILSLVALAGLLFVSTFTYAQNEKLIKRLQTSTTVLNEIMGIPEKGVPRYLLAGAAGVVVFPSVVKAGFIVGGRYGKGVVSYRDKRTGRWSPPAFLTIGGGSIGYQIGVQAIDLVMIITSRRGIEGLLRSKFTLGGDASIAAGPVGRRTEASTDILLKAEIYSYSRTKGLFAGISLEGAVISHDNKANRSFYGRPITVREILFQGKLRPPRAAREFVNTLTRYSSAVR